jgi:S-adenosylmethionine decarboxylase proenzyme
MTGKARVGQVADDRRGAAEIGGTPAAAWRLGLAGLLAVGVAYGFARYGYGLFVPQIRREHGLSLTALGAIASAGYVGYLVALVTVGVLVSKVGFRPLVLTGTLCATAGLAIVALSPGPVVLALGILLAGSSPGWVWAPFSDAVKRTVPPRSRERLLAVISTGTTFGVIVAAPAALLAGPQTWRQVWLAFAVVALAVTGYNLAVLPSDPPGPERRISLRQNGIRWFVRPASVPLYLTALSFGLLGSVFWSFAVVLVAEARGAGEATVPLFWGLVGISGIAGVLTGSLVRRAGLRRAHLVIVAGLAVGIGTLGAAPGWLPAILASAVCYGASFMAMAALLAIWSSVVFPEQPATGFSATVLLLALGSLAGPVAAGAVAELSSLPASFALATVIAVLTFLAWPRALAGTAAPMGERPAGDDLKAQFQRDEHGHRYAGRHVFIDLWDVPRANDADLVRATIAQAVSACGATLLDLRLHEFEPAGITAVAVISESHLSFHTWPQEGYAAVDIFTCGELDPQRAVPVLRQRLAPGRIRVVEHKRGYRHLAVEDT